MSGNTSVGNQIKPRKHLRNFTGHAQVHQQVSQHTPTHTQLFARVCVCVCVMTWSGVGVTPTTFAWWLLLLLPLLPLRLFIHSSHLSEWNDSWSKKEWLSVAGTRHRAAQRCDEAYAASWHWKCRARFACQDPKERERETDRGMEKRRGSSCWCMTWLLDEPIVVDRFMNSLWSVRSLMTSQATRKTHMQLSASLLFSQRPSAIGSYYNAVMKPKHTQLKRRQIQRYVDTKIQIHWGAAYEPLASILAVLAEAFLCV